MDDQVNGPEIQPEDPETRELSDRRNFLRSFGKWSTAAIAAILLSESTPSTQASGWPNRRGSSWHNSGTDSINRGGSWVNGGWINRGGRWLA